MISYNPGSFRDPSGRVFELDEGVYRTITDLGEENFLAVGATGLLENLMASGKLVPWQEVDFKAVQFEVPSRVCHIMELEKLAFISYPYEWSFTQLKTAADLFLEIMLESLEHDVILVDGSAFNIQFKGHQPIFIDHLSFVPYADRQYWIGHKQFCEHFFNPLVISSKFGVSHNNWFRGSMDGLSTKDCAAFLGVSDWFSPKLLMNVLMPQYFDNKMMKDNSHLTSSSRSHSGLQKNALLALVKRMKHWVSQIQYKPSSASVWADYQKINTYLDDEIVRKTEFVSKFVSQVKPDCLLDLGCNTGYYSELALSQGAKSVIGFENDRDAHEIASRMALEKKLMFLPLFIDLTNPSPAQGWLLAERNPLFDRVNADGVLALAVIHHLVFRHNIPVDETVRFIVSLAPTGIIEYVPKEDKMAANLIGDRQDLFTDYTYENILDLIRENNRVVSTEQITGSGRVMIQYHREN